MSLELHGVLGRGEFRRDVDLAINSGEVWGITGRNGCGKSTLLHTIAGLEKLQSGSLTVNESLWDDSHKQFVVPEDRKVALVFQDIRLFPHMSVLRNVCYPLRAQGVTRVLAISRARQMLELVGMTSAHHRTPDSLSGGERQRVGLARALVAQPSVLLLDEPLSAVDASSRPGLQSLLALMLAEFSGIAIVVSHDESDLAAMATHHLEM